MLTKKEKEIDKQFINELAELIDKFKNTYVKSGLREVEAKAIIASSLEYASQNAAKFRREAGID